MAFQVSPGVNVSEIDLTGIVPAVSTSVGAIAGVFRWGPVNERTLVSNEKQLTQIFGEPKTYYTDPGTFSQQWTNHETFFSAANFLSYSNALYVTRTASATAAAAASTYFDAKYVGDLGNSIEVSFCSTDSAGDTASFDAELQVNTITIQPFARTATATGFGSSAAINSTVPKGTAIILGDTGIRLIVESVTAEDVGGSFNANITFTTPYTGTATYNDTFSTQWSDSNRFLSAPSANSVHVVVRDLTGEISGTAGSILEIYENVSTVPGTANINGTDNYIGDVLENRSKYISTTQAKANAMVASSIFSFGSLTGGADGDDEGSIAIGDVVQGYDLYRDSETVDISLLIQGKGRGTVLANYITNNIAEFRKDCVVFASPEESQSNTVDQILSWAAGLTGSSYMFVDSGYKYQYDKYNDVYRWVPLNGDIAGLCARTDNDRDPWFSPAGYNRGIIKNVVRLRVNPPRAERDRLYLNSINPVISEPGSGTLLFGDKTYSPINSAFDRINVRRLFIVLEKAIATASKALLFEFNDEFTRAQFVNLVEPFLREVQGRRGIFDFRVVCDETNNTAEVIDGNQFVGDIFVKPARSINFIQLNFVAVRTGVEFEEVVGAV